MVIIYSIQHLGSYCPRLLIIDKGNREPDVHGERNKRVNALGGLFCLIPERAHYPGYKTRLSVFRLRRVNIAGTPLAWYLFFMFHVLLIFVVYIVQTDSKLLSYFM